TAKDLIRNHFKLACELLIDKMPKLVEHLKRTVPPKPKQHWAYRPDRHIPWQLD
ncbi:MAG: hypothetical protein JNM56_28855, partial [Planctomycetia bacterium]|nr:hypothetical protein [Planctomycetia bacterium]